MTLKTTTRKSGRRTTWTTTNENGEVVLVRTHEKGTTRLPAAVPARAVARTKTPEPVKLRTVSRSATGGPRGSVTVVPGSTPSVVAEDVAVKATVPLPAGTAHIGQTSLDAAIPAGTNVIGKVRIEHSDPVIGSGSGTALAAGTVTADTLALPAGVYRVEFVCGSSGVVAAGKHLQLEHRNAANGANIHNMAVVPAGQAGYAVWERVVVALNERFRVIVGAVAFAASEVAQAQIRVYLIP